MKPLGRIYLSNGRSREFFGGESEVAVVFRSGVEFCMPLYAIRVGDMAATGKPEHSGQMYDTLMRHYPVSLVPVSRIEWYEPSEQTNAARPLTASK